MRPTSAPQSPPCHDRCDRAGRVYECLFTSSPRQFSQQEQLTKIEPGWPAPLCSAQPSYWESGRGAGGEGVREGGRRWKGGIVCLWKRAMGQDYQSSVKLRRNADQKCGHLEWSCLQWCEADIIQNNKVWRSNHWLVLYKPRMKRFNQKQAEPCATFHTYCMVTIWSQCNVGCS